MVLEFKLRLTFVKSGVLLPACGTDWISELVLLFVVLLKQVLHFSIFHSSLADQKKEEGNQLYLAKNYREALQRYNEAISKFLCDWIWTTM